MLSSGNGNPEICVHNLLAIVQGENPYERCKGVDIDITDSPVGEAIGIIAAEVVQVLEEYEPRMEMDDIVTVADDVLAGRYRLNADINTEEMYV